MRKLTLRLEDLDVTAFEVSAATDDLVGTIQGADALTIRTRCAQLTCDTCDQDTCLC